MNQHPRNDSEIIPFPHLLVYSCRQESIDDMASDDEDYDDNSNDDDDDEKRVVSLVGDAHPVEVSDRVLSH